MAGKGRGDIGSLPGRTKDATQGVKALSGAFDELSAKGRLSAASFNQMAGALGQVNPILGLVAAGIGLVVAQGERLKALELADAMTQFSASTRVITNEWEGFNTKLEAGAGESGELRDVLEQLAEKQQVLRDRTQRYNEELAKQNDLVRKGGDENLAAQKLAGVANQLSNNLPQIYETVAALEKRGATIRRNTELQKHFNQSVSVENSLAAAHAAGEIQRRGFLSKAKADELAEGERVIGQLDRQYQMQVQVGDQNASSTLEMITATQARIEVLKSEAATYQYVGDMAMSAIGGAAAGAFNAYADALDKTVSLNQIFAGGFDRAMRNMAAATIRSVGQQAAVRAVFELAEGFAAMGNPALAGLASFHFRAAALFGGIAVAAGPAAGLTSVMPAGGGGGGSGRGDGKGGSSSGNGRVVNVYPVIWGVPDDAAVSELARRIRDAVEKGDV